MRFTPDEQRQVATFNPHMTYTMRRAVLQKLLLERPSPAFWNGRTYRIKSKHLAAGVYEVTGEFTS